MSSRPNPHDPIAAGARRILDHMQAVYRPTHRYVEADLRRFRYLDLPWYDRTAAALEAVGFRRLGDLEDETISNAPNGVLRPTFLRTLVSRDGTAIGALYDPRIKGWGLRLLLRILRKLPGKVAEFETECSDGSFVATSNAPAAARAIALPPQIDVAWLPVDTDAPAVYAAHTARLADHLRARPGVTPLVMRTREEMIRSQDRQNALKAAYRGEIPGLTREELDALSLLGPEILPDMETELRAQHAARRAG